MSILFYCLDCQKEVIRLNITNREEEKIGGMLCDDCSIKFVQIKSDNKREGE